jgi:hypothetical protein
LEQFDDALAGGVLVHLQVELQGLADLAADGQHRVERGHRVLEDHGDLFAPDLAHLVLVQIEQVLAAKVDFALDDFAGGLGDQTHDAQGADAFAAAALAYHAEGFFLIDVERDIVHRLDDAILGEKLRF